ncbi:Hypothetical_protein [Hexamita inflata]|uniref:Hypothetical_protein n=1 Tax=Hexamita inflata TaxID=28002 RepID=A0AA86P8M9_9EUKA|nr:Hypothetical protein HINF_LOCUS19839 [Hexamita inflata]
MYNQQTQCQKEYQNAKMVVRHSSDSLNQQQQIQAQAIALKVKKRESPLLCPPLQFVFKILPDASDTLTDSFLQCKFIYVILISKAAQIQFDTINRYIQKQNSKENIALKP